MLPDQESVRTPDAVDVAAFYDGHAANVQRRVGINQRHRSIMRRLKRSGMRSTHKVLEIGCGIGTLTSLLAKAVSQGHVHAVDISPAAVEMARLRLARARHVEFGVSDMSDFSSASRYDRIVLPDVLEHIPEAQHDSLFRTLAAHLAPGGMVCINMPDPEALEHLRRTDPKQLQIIDQSLPILHMAERFAVHGLLLDRFERYRIWATEPDYDWIEFRWPNPLAVRRPKPYLERAMRGVWAKLF